MTFNRETLFHSYLKLLLVLFFTTTVNAQAPIGLSMLYCVDPPNKSALRSCNQKVEILKKTRLTNISISVLLGGSFGKDFSYIKKVIKELGGTKKLHIVFYLTNGSSQRSWRTTEVRGVFTQVDPKLNREFIDNNFDKITNVFNDFIELAEFNSSLGGENRLVLQLEDNFSNKDYSFFLSKFKELLQTKKALSPEIGRDPCNCYPSAEGFIGSDLFEVYHYKKSKFKIPTGGVVTNDGAELLFSKSSKYPRSISLNDILRAKELSYKRNSWFLLWSAKAQGLNQENILEPSLRNYELYDQKEVRHILDYILITPTE